MSLVMDRIQEHYQYASKNFEKNNIIGIFLVGSQNYGTDLPTSDVDTRLVVAPTLEEIYQNKRGESSTIYLPNTKEQINIKDIRCLFSEFKKQNINSLEILYTDYCIVNELYKSIWQSLIDEREDISHYNKRRAIKAIKGNLFNTYNRMYLDNGMINKKQVANLVRYEYFLRNFINGEPYAKCLRPDGQAKEYITQIRTGEMGEASMKIIADSTKQTLEILLNAYELRPDVESEDINVENTLDKLCKEFIDTAFFAEYAQNGEI